METRDSLRRVTPREKGWLSILPLAPSVTAMDRSGSALKTPAKLAEQSVTTWLAGKQRLKIDGKTLMSRSLPGGETRVQIWQLNLDTKKAAPLRFKQAKRQKEICPQSARLFEDALEPFRYITMIHSQTLALPTAPHRSPKASKRSSRNTRSAARTRTSF